MKILKLTLNKKPFDVMITGEKNKEYRKMKEGSKIKKGNRGKLYDIKTNYKYQKNYELIIESSIKYNLSENIGLIIGATSPDDLSFVRSMSADIPILCPGIGAQSGNLGRGILLPSPGH